MILRKDSPFFFTLHEHDEIAERTHMILANIYRKHGWKHPPTVTSGLVAKVLEVAASVAEARSATDTGRE